VRDAILFSRWIWETFNAPERFALALAHIGARVLYRENPDSGLLRTGSKLREVAGAGNSTGCIFFSPSGETLWDPERLKLTTKRFTHANIDIRDGGIIEELFRRYAITSIATTWCVRSRRLLLVCTRRGLQPPAGTGVQHLNSEGD